jgi:two-component system response regulator AtoC
MEKPSVQFVDETTTGSALRFSPGNHQPEQRNTLVADPLLDGVFGSPEMTRAYKIASLVAVTDVPVLITGESGVGKEVFAQFIHKHSPRASNPLIRVNCAALPNDLLESELFGYERGAFTGAITEKPGKFELASGGTILLDEIAEMSPRLQAKLLHVLQDGEFSRLGGRRQLRADARILASTNRKLEEAVSRGEFRDDLYFRLNVIRIKIPPLRERKQEIVHLSNYFIRKYGEKYGKSLQELPPDILKVFLDHNWPGNVRELENAIKRYLILPHLGIEIAELSQDRTCNAAASTAPAIPIPNFQPKPLPTEFSSLKEAGVIAAEEAERKLILLALDQTNWNRKQAAHRLNICYKALLNRIKKWQLQKPELPERRNSRHKGVPAEQPVEQHSSV